MIMNPVAVHFSVWLAFTHDIFMLRTRWWYNESRRYLQPFEDFS